jgi:hypothetical protein
MDPVKSSPDWDRIIRRGKMTAALKRAGGERSRLYRLSVIYPLAKISGFDDSDDEHAVAMFRRWRDLALDMNARAA